MSPNSELFAVAVAFYNRMGDASSCWILYQEMKKHRLRGTLPLYRTMMKVAGKDGGPHESSRAAIIALEAAMNEDGVTFSTPQDMVYMINAWTNNRRGGGK